MSIINELLARPSLRLFQVGRESYVIFTGEDASHKRSFLRIGDIGSIPAEALPYIEGIVCTHHILGNPIQEKEYLRSLAAQQRPYFAGVPAVLKRYKNFFNLNKAVRAKYESLSEAAERKIHKSGPFLYYTDLDQIEVFINTTRILSLRARALQDGHRHARNGQLARLYGQYAYPYSAGALSQSGFFMIKGALYCYDKGKIFAINPPVGAYDDLMLHAFDARTISGGIHAAAGESFLSLITNETLKYPPTEWYFDTRSGSINAADINVLTEFAGKKIKAHHVGKEMEIALSNARLRLDPDTEQPQLEVEKDARITLDRARSMWTLAIGEETFQGAIIPNLPYTISLPGTTNSAQLLTEYLPSAFNQGTHRCSGSETALLNALLRFARARATRIFAVNYRQIAHTIKKVARKAEPFTYYALNNFLSILDAEISEYQSDPERLPWVKKAHAQVQWGLNKITPPVSADERIYPRAAVMIRKCPAGFRQFVKYDWNIDLRHVEHEERIRGNMMNIMEDGRDEIYARERARLLACIAELDGANKELDDALAPEDRPNDARGARQQAESTQKKDAQGAKKSVSLENISKVLKTGGYNPQTTRLLLTILAILFATALIFALLFIPRDDDGRRRRIARDERRAPTTTETTPDDAADSADSTADTSDDADGASGADGADSTADSADSAATADSTNINERIARGAPNEGDIALILNPDALLFSDIYLTFDSPLGSVNVTLEEIVRLVNTIALQNGFRELAAEEDAGNDPDLIYPANRLSLPTDNNRYTIDPGDSLWRIALSLIEIQTRDFLSRLASLKNIIDNETLTSEERSRAQRTVDGMIADSHSESLADVARQIRALL